MANQDDNKEFTMTSTDIAPFRSLEDFLTKATFTGPTLNDAERMSYRITNNLIYYQSNYFLCAISIFFIIGILHPKDMMIGIVALVLAFFLIVKEKDQSSRVRRGLAALFLLHLLMHMLGSIMVFIWGVTMPIAAVLLHAACRKRNLKNKIFNVSELLRDKLREPTPMSVILSALCQDNERR